MKIKKLLAGLVAFAMVAGAYAVTVTITASFSDSNTGMTRNPNKTITVTGNNFDYELVAVATSDTPFTFSSDIGNAHYVFIRNTDTQNFVEVGIDVTAYTMKLLATDFALFPITPTATNIHLKADTSACEVEVWVREL